MSKKYNLFLISLNESLCQFMTMPVKDVQMNRYQIMIKAFKVPRPRGRSLKCQIEDKTGTSAFCLRVNQNDMRVSIKGLCISTLKQYKIHSS